MSVSDSINFLKNKELLNPIFKNEVVNHNYMSRFLDLCGNGFINIDNMDIRMLSSELTLEKDKIRSLLIGLSTIGIILTLCYNKSVMTTNFDKEIKFSVTESILKELE
jgi:hypothetical protein